MSLLCHPFVTVWLPFRAPKICSVSRAKMVTLLLLSAMAIYNAHVFWTIELRQRSIGANQTSSFCGAHKRSRFMREMFNYVNFISYSIIPFVCVLILNVCIIVKLIQSTPELIAQASTRTHAMVKHRRQLKVTYTLLILSLAFLLLTGPYTLHSLIVKDTREPKIQARNLLSKTVCFLLMYLNHSINFYLYCISGKKFRKELNKLLCVSCRHQIMVRRHSPTSRQPAQKARKHRQNELVLEQGTLRIMGVPYD
ncbi:hypothetical protein CAPTEDRAFT_188046 [Capitella teleta]|uniref:G-protein coupled receptors family 1 profile domain-containing protein n=1 Tax=Capitella teleta TaxID=283909 RepID=R7UVZ0_CAPTE|nr:hypothetical protein CAPTEDRAFT_188046 [Capitella teleta]|eukprot:ELU07541.1 hypothetical protein CAPTEDRAFT_188046 [Capitella teleta]